jgi:hypothetical protein
MSETTINISIDQASEKSFGVVFSIVFLIIALYPIFSSSYIHIWALVLSVIFLLCAFLTPKILKIPNKLWFKFGLLIGSIMVPIVMFLLYFITILPIGIIMRLLVKDLLKQDLDASAKSYWIERSVPIGSMKNQF